ncbi:MAG TPA: PAS domain S-box protein [Desulfuromonadales bacterium]|nr:PAS domain S-box protein [Desulfuromonadales bacterium]
MSSHNHFLQFKKNFFIRICLAIVVIFMSHLFFDLVLPEDYPWLSKLSLEFIESLVASIIAVPCLWWFVFKPTLFTPQITEANQKLENSEARFRNLATFSPVGIFENDAQGNYIFVNQKWTEIMGLTSDQVLGQGWLSVLHSEDKQKVEEEWVRAVAAGWEFRLEYRVSFNSTTDKWVSVSATPLKAHNGNINSIMGIVTDVTERHFAETALRESEDRFRTLFEYSEDAILLLAPGTCTVIDVNSTAERLYGYSKTEMIGYDFNLFKQLPECSDCLLSMCQLTGSDILNIEHAVQFKKDGTEIHVSIRAKVLTLQGENAISCTMRDISQRLRLEEEARIMQARMIHSNKMTSLGLLVAGIAHEINNPNNYIMVNAQMLYKVWQDLAPMLKEEEMKNGEFILGGLPYSQLEEALPGMITAINEGSRRIKNIISALKVHSRNGKSVMSSLELNRVVNAAMLLLRHHVKKYSGNFVIELEDGIPCIWGNSQQLEQVIINLVMNALQSLTDKVQRISLKTTLSLDKSSVLLTVADEGCGIPDAVKSRIMDPFFTIKIDSGGTGLGLSITRSIVLLHQGTIDFSSQAGEGTVVTVSLPVADVNKEGDCRNE